MKLLTPFAAIVAAATAGQIYTSQPSEAYANSAEIYQSALEYQQQGLYSDQSHAYSGQSDTEHAYSAQNAGHADQQAYSGQSGYSRPAGEKTARILSQVSENDGHGYQYSYETENGIKAQEMGQIAGHESGTEAHGAYSYTGDDGQVYTVTYSADEHGFHAQGSHLPTPPPIPEAIAKSLEQNAKDEAAGIYDDGKYVEQQHHHQQQQAIQHHELAVGSDGHQQAGYQQVGHQQAGHQQASHQQAEHQQAGHQQTAQAFQYETTAFQHDNGFQPAYHILNVPVEGYHKH